LIGDLIGRTPQHFLTCPKKYLRLDLEKKASLFDWI